MTIDTARAVGEVPEWEELEMMVDSGASVTVINREMVKAVEAKGARPNVKYEVADGSFIENMGQKTFSAVTECGVPRKMTAEVTDVSKALLSVAKIVKAGNRVVFAEGDCYIEDNATKQRIPITERNGAYVLKLWINRNQEGHF